ncbi:KAT8 regulatory NSL complex subunit 3 isoform X2 [Phymastichus coffea]|uniref:KAT8 regulatory NSL complex subunit 3 isoform X2 n=1 Tax=Phymastichus coffea TaxID=108790 RepID=UPI00273B5B03|nr:KAT8 regulatory NSL complex subunit 3 isoform X2 [Phymastichus coffea]
MLITNQSATSTNQSVNPSMPSPTGEVMEENLNKLISYLHQLAGTYEVEVDAILKDHCYARPWNWKPENAYVKPVKKLFFPKSSGGYLRDNNQDEIVNVDENDSETIAPPYDLAKMKQSMDEFQRVANFVKPEDTDSDWEEKIDKILWSSVQNRVFARVVRILNSERVARLAKVTSLHEPILRRTSIDTTAKKFRECLASVNWDWRITQWLHSLLFDYLPQNYLAIYLDILQTLRQKIPQLIDKMVAIQPNVNAKSPSSVTWETLGPLLKKSWDPVGPILNANKPKKLPGNPILIIVPSGLSINMSSRQHKWITQFGHLGMVITVTPHVALTTNRLTVMAGIEQLIQATRGKIQDARADYPSRPIILIGFNSGAGIACQIGQMEHVTAIVCLGFPFSTVDGRRGTPEDTILDLRCPVMFIIGQHSTISRVDDIEDLRERMLVATNLVVVGSADDHLRVSTSKKVAEKISQGMVDRCILDEIADFIGSILVQPHPLPLRAPGRKNDNRKRRNSTNNSEVNDSQLPSLKKLRPQSPQQVNATGNSTITTNMLPKGTLVALTGTAATQTPRRKSRTAYASGQTAQSSIDNTSGGITLNIGSFASLSPVGPIRFEPTSISLQTPGKSGNTIKTTNAFIKVSKNNQVNIGGPQNVAKIKMIMPTKKIAHRSPGGKLGEVSMVNVLAPSSAHIKINPPVAGNLNTTPGTIMPPITTVKNPLNAATTGKPANVLLATKVSPTTTSIATTTTSIKVADISTMAVNRKPVQNQSSRPPPPLAKTSRSPSKSLHSSKLPTEQNHNIEDLGNILDIPIIIAKEGENLEHLQPNKMPKLLFIGSSSIGKNELPVKYTKFIIAKRTDEADVNRNPSIILTKNRRPSGKLLVLNSKVEEQPRNQFSDVQKTQK